jgi:hypothetical protein
VQVKSRNGKRNRRKTLPQKNRFNPYPNLFAWPRWTQVNESIRQIEDGTN